MQLSLNQSESGGSIGVIPGVAQEIEGRAGI
jgi:hypothetical protein